MTGIETALAIAGTAMSVVGTIASAQSQAAGMEYNAAVSRNAAIAARQQGEESGRRARREAVLRLGQIAANRGASGIALEGSPLDVTADAAAELELQARDAEYQGLTRSMFYNQQAGLDEFNASNTRMGGYWSAAGTILGAGLQYGRSLLPSGTAAGPVTTPRGIRPGVTAGGPRF